MALQIRNVLKNDVLRLVMLEHPKDVLEKVAPFRAIEALLVSGLGERLAGRARTEDVVSGNAGNGHLTDVSARAHAEVFLVKSLQVYIELAGKYAVMAQALQADMKSSEPCEQVHELPRTPCV